MSLLYKVRDKRRFLAAALAELAGVAQVSFEGDLSSTSLFDVAGACSDETQVLKRNTLWPKQDFVVLPLEAETVAPIMAAVGGTVSRVSSTYRSKKTVGSNLAYTITSLPNVCFLGQPGINVLRDIARCRNSGALDRTIMPAPFR
jgi:hypothetical protein